MLVGDANVDDPPLSIFKDPTISPAPFQGPFSPHKTESRSVADSVLDQCLRHDTVRNGQVIPNEAGFGSINSSKLRLHVAHQLGLADDHSIGSLIPNALREQVAVSFDIPVAECCAGVFVPCIQLGGEFDFVWIHTEL